MRRSKVAQSDFFPGFTDIVEIGIGSLATVYRAREIGTNRNVALKLLNVRDASPRAIDSFERESIALGAVSSHPNIVTLYRSFRAGDGRPVLVLELCTGSIGGRTRIGHGLPVPEVLSIGIKIAGALETAHRAEILHRDVKPQNILMTEFGEPALADFGVAMLQSSTRTTAGLFDFTTLHAAPELLEGGETSAATDVYELASSIYQLISGRSAFRAYDGESPASVILRILRDPVQPLVNGQVPTRLSDLLICAMSKDKASRPATAAQFAAELAEIEVDQQWPRTQFLIRDPSVPGGPPLAAPDWSTPIFSAHEADAVSPATASDSADWQPPPLLRETNGQGADETIRRPDDWTIGPWPPEVAATVKPLPAESGEVGLEPKAHPSPTPPGIHARANPGDSAEATVMRSALQPPAPFAAQHRSPHPASTVAEPTVRRSSVPQPSPAAPTGQPGAPYAGAEQTVMRSSLPPTMPAPPTSSDSRREPQGYRPLPEPSFNGQETVARSGLSIPQYPIPPSRTHGADAHGGAVPMWASRTPPPPPGANQPQPHTDLAIDPMSLRRRVTIRSGASALLIDEQHLVLRSWWRKTEIAWSDVLGFELRFETTNVSGSGGHLVAVTYNGPVELPAAKRPMADLRYVQALLEAYRRRSHMMPR